MNRFADVLSVLPEHFRNGVEFAIQEQIRKPNGHIETWERAFAEILSFTPSSFSLDCDTILIGSAQDVSTQEQTRIKELLLQFHPWRKGPYDVFGVHIDTEWRSDWKWQRVSPHISSLEGRKVLDVGCGSGYHSWRMYGAGASLVLGIDPSMLFWMQFRIMKELICTIHHNPLPVYFAPIPMEAIPTNTQFFDTVFSMGVLYHRRDPFAHLDELKQALKKGGELILETLITEGPLHHCFVPEDRYAQMRNVWFLPSLDTLLFWLKRIGFQNIRVVDINQTSTEEQRSTEWMRFQSLCDYLDPNDKDLTIEGYPAPKRATIIANR